MGRKAARINTGVVIHFGGFNFESEYPDPAPIAKVKIIVPTVIDKLLKICLTKFWEGSINKRKLPNQNEKSKEVFIIDLLGKKARITVQTIGIRVITIAITIDSSKKKFTFNFWGAFSMMISETYSFFSANKQIQLLVLTQVRC